MGIWEHEGHVENLSRRWGFSTFLRSCSQMAGVFTRLRLLHLLYDIDFTRAKNKTLFVLYSDKTWWVFAQSEHAQGYIYNIICNESQEAAVSLAVWRAHLTNVNVTQCSNSRYINLVKKETPFLCCRNYMYQLLV